MSIRLAVIQDTTKPVQDCSVCKTRSICWQPGIRDEHVMISLLVCRMKRGIDVNSSTKSLLNLIRPKLRKLAKRAIQGTQVPMETALADMESKAVEYLLKNYMLGDAAFPLHFLFAVPGGHMTHFANNYARKEQEYNEFYPLESDVESYISESYTIEDSTSTTKETELARTIINDGITLTRTEYRVFKFCMTNAIEGKRPISGLHVYLAKVMGTNRAKINRIYLDAARKIQAAVCFKLEIDPAEYN